jgi:hypothetical protein
MSIFFQVLSETLLNIYQPSKVGMSSHFYQMSILLERMHEGEGCWLWRHNTVDVLFLTQTVLFPTLI